MQRNDILSLLGKETLLTKTLMFIKIIFQKWRWNKDNKNLENVLQAELPYKKYTEVL